MGSVLSEASIAVRLNLKIAFYLQTGKQTYVIQV